MADRFIAIDTAKDAGEQLPEAVRDEVNEVVGGTISTAVTGAVTGAIESQVADGNIVAAAPRIRARQVVACFTFDDCPVEDITAVKPILDGKGVKGGFPFPSGYPGLTGLASWAQMKSLQDAGHEILAHSVNHAHLDTYATPAMSLADTTAQIDNQSVYQSHGIAVRGFAYPFGEHTPTLRRLVRDHYDYALATGTNSSGSQNPLRTYAIRRIALKDSTVTADHYAQIDTAIANGEILVFIVHAGAAAAEFTSAGGGYQRLADVIQYCLDHSVPVRTPSQAFDMVHNNIDTGDFVASVGLVVDSEGRSYNGGAALGVPVLDNASDALTKLPTAFNTGITLQKYQSSTGAPGSGPGTVETHIVTTTDTAAGGLNYQLYQRNGNNGLYIRAATTDLTGWTAWTQVGGGSGVTQLAGSTSAIGTLPSAYAAGITLQSVLSTASPVTPRPDNGPGVLRTTILVAGSSGVTTGQLNYQEFIGTNGFGHWIRPALSDNSGWGAWSSTTITPSGSINSNATPAPPNVNGFDFQLNINALAVGATVAAPQASAPTDGQELTLRIKDNGTPQTLAFNAIYRFPSTVTVPTSTTASQVLFLVFRFDAADTKWDYVAGNLAGSGDVAAATHAATAKTVPVSADEFALVDSASGNVLKRIPYADLLAAVQTGVERENVSVGETTLPRGVLSGSTTLSSGIIRIGYFQAVKTESTTQVWTAAVGTAAAGSTLCRMGIFSIDGSGNLTLIASTPNDTTLWAATNTPYTKAFSAAFSKVRGTRYAFGALFVGTTAPVILGANGQSSDAMAVSPRLCAALSGQTDLPSTISVGSLVNGTQRAYAALLP